MEAQEKQISVLVVDDSNAMRTTLSEALSREGYQVQTAVDGYEAVKHLKERSFDLLTLDIEMPRLGGMEVLRIAKRLDPDACVLMVTSLKTLQIALDAIRMGAYDYITKPFEVDNVMISVRRALERKALQRENARLLSHLTEMNQKLEEMVRERTAELEQANAELGQAYRELQELDRLKSEFITIASHELRTPLVAIQGYTNIILSGRMGPLNDRQKSGLQVAETNIHRLVRIVNDLLDITRLDARKMTFRAQPFSVPELLEQMRREVQTLTEQRRQTLLVDSTGSPPDQLIALADRDRNVQVLFNLISNAIRFTPDEGRITLGCRRLDPDWIEVWVQDTGIGIDPMYHQKIFEPFFEVQSSEYHTSGTIEFKSGGSGLGLSIVRGIVQQQGGSIRVESESGLGSSFIFTLPAAPPA